MADLNTYQSQALEYQRAGFSVIPVGENKVPKRSWKERTKQLPTDAEVIEDFRQPAGIGIVAGKVSGNLEVIDIDIEDMAEADACRDSLLSNSVNACKKLGIDCSGLSGISVNRTPRNGLHLFYRCIEPVSGSQKLARHNGKRVDSTGEHDSTTGYHIETRGEGGYCLSPGSADFSHPLGASKYQHIAGPKLIDLKPSVSPELRDVLLCEAKFLGIDGDGFEDAQSMQAAMSAKQDQQPAEAERASVTLSPIRNTNVSNNIMMTWAEILEPHGFTQAETVDGVTYWKRPGSKNKHSASTNYQGTDLFYPWSPNCHPALEANRGYNKLATYTALVFGDHSSEAFRLAAQQLRSDGKLANGQLDHIDISEALRCKEQPAIDFFEFESFSEFMSKEEETEYLCEEIIAKGQSCVIAGPQKSLKTGIGGLDLGYALATGGYFLDVFPCPRPVRVGIMTGESNRPKIQRVMRTKSQSPLTSPRCEPMLHITRKLPDFSQEQQLRHLENSISLHGLEVVIVDPVYLCLGSYADSTSNVSAMGNLLRSIDEITQPVGCTPIILHHTNRKHEPHKPLTLRDISGAGFAEWARQWILLSPRSDFDPATYQHSLWMVAGGSAGHAGKYAVDVFEKGEDGEWAWITEVRSEGEEKAAYKERKEQRKEDAEKAKSEEFVRNLKMAIVSREDGSTINDIKRYFKENGFPLRSRINREKLDDFVEFGFVKKKRAKRGNNQNVDAYFPADEWAEPTEQPSEQESKSCK
ncbi:AAA family ATPase [Thalassoglobus sp.]|uniref:AAA family ATPase n=1 Tax=Thalassoglobus sp. TaxID=2795869 RepID=UPI003AA8926D